MRDRLPLLISITALSVAVFGSTPLGEAAYNAVAPASIGPKELRNGAVTNEKLRGDAVTSGKVLNGTLRLVDFRANQIPAGPAGPKGDKGEKGERGEKGPKGDKGDPALSGYQVVQGPSVPLPANSVAFGKATCPTGKRAVGGGGSHSSGVGFVANMGQSIPAPNSGNTTWQVGFKNPTTNPAAVQTYVICATVTP